MRYTVDRAVIAVLTLATSWTATARAQTAAPDYDATLATAAALTATGHPAEAARTLEPLRRAYPDDYAVALQLGWLTFSAHDLASARSYYGHALLLSQGSSLDARLGMGWTALRAGDVTAATRAFETVLAASPGNASAEQGLALAREAAPRALRAWASVWLGAQTYSHHPVLRWAASVAPSLTLQLADTVVMSVTYRALQYQLASNTLSLQQELHASFGVEYPAWGVRVHVGTLWDSGNTLGPAGVVGLSARLRAHGALTAEVSRTAFTDTATYRLAAGWALALGPHGSVGPVASVQSTGAGLGGAVGLAASVAQDGYALSVSGRVGDERRATYLNESVTVATNDHVRAALSAVGRMPLGGGLTLAAGCTWQRLAVEGTGTGTGTTTAADAWYFSAALEGSW